MTHDEARVRTNYDRYQCHQFFSPTLGSGCVECLATGGWWVHLRRCAQCGHVGCCDSSVSKHARAHATSHGHPVAQSFEPGEDWFWNYEKEEPVDGPVLKPPHHRPLDQPVPGPEGSVPANWRSLLI
ncbi:UBP-type zinc finger domain-containing protein [Mesorhizobium sp. J428]|uniref:UBP-type zinc finger domain-containing protein n=1 Tax=Mesorhizobium sp. J428 TaxID=2898440 RepID=UPI002151BAF8|nr:UBP-type zinc finger domain-containing protein [Mesorhizobium sp. J428]MCR5856410.1 UBP-type zinc finger domain-containing protein [Mesorhizobium sp. J428]